jgi:hypothetical protein
MAMPPDFVSPRGSLVEYVDIDDLARIADRRPRGADADSFVAEAAAHRRYSEGSCLVGLTGWNANHPEVSGPRSAGQGPGRHRDEASAEEP